MVAGPRTPSKISVGTWCVQFLRANQLSVEDDFTFFSLVLGSYVWPPTRCLGRLRAFCSIKVKITSGQQIEVQPTGFPSTTIQHSNCDVTSLSVELKGSTIRSPCMALPIDSEPDPSLAFNSPLLIKSHLTVRNSVKHASPNGGFLFLRFLFTSLCIRCIGEVQMTKFSRRPLNERIILSTLSD